MGCFYIIELPQVNLAFTLFLFDHENNYQSQCSKIHRLTSSAFSCNYLQWGTHNTTVAPLPCIAEETKIWSTTKKKAWEINNHMLRHSCEWCRRHCRTSGPSLGTKNHGFHCSILGYSFIRSQISITKSYVRENLWILVHEISWVPQNSWNLLERGSCPYCSDRDHSRSEPSNHIVLQIFRFVQKKKNLFKC